MGECSIGDEAENRDTQIRIIATETDIRHVMNSHIRLLVTLLPNHHGVRRLGEPGRRIPNHRARQGIEHKHRANSEDENAHGARGQAQ